MKATLFQLPHSQRGHEQAFRAGERADRRRLFLRRSVSRAPCAGGRDASHSSRTNGGIADRQMAAVVHESLKSSLRASRAASENHHETPRKRLCGCAFSGQLHAAWRDRKLGCLSIFLFVVLCASVLLQRRPRGGRFQPRSAAPRASRNRRRRFRETVHRSRPKGGPEKIARHRTLRGVISSSFPGMSASPWWTICGSRSSRRGRTTKSARSSSRSIRPAVK